MYGSRAVSEVVDTVGDAGECMSFAAFEWWAIKAAG